MHHESKLTRKLPTIMQPACTKTLLHHMRAPRVAMHARMHVQIYVHLEVL
jgi:hypothetical protein